MWVKPVVTGKVCLQFEPFLQKCPVSQLIGGLAARIYAANTSQKKQLKAAFFTTGNPQAWLALKSAARVTPTAAPAA